MKFLKISNIKLNIYEDNDNAFKKAIKIAGIQESDVIEKNLLKLSIDARNKNMLQKVITAELCVKSYNSNRKNVMVYNERPKYRYQISGTKVLENRPVVIGFGPAGMFCSYLLALNGYQPIIIERGSKVEERTKKVEHFWKTGKLDTECNVQFGEGGAGTFSDGKLNTGIKDKNNRIQFVLETFVKFGADPKILYDAKPHIGTDILSLVVKNMREEIKRLGGEFHFNSTLTDINIQNSGIYGIILNNQKPITTNVCVLAIGHSARDTFEMLHNHAIPMEQKPFAVGVRVEHTQNTINLSQYGTADERLDAAPYKLTYKTNNNRGVYSFCMCPGGFVVNASSEKGQLAVNGMSYSKRNGVNANSAIVVTVSPKDFPSDDILSGMEFQRTLECRAYQEGNGKIPVQKFQDFKSNLVSKCYGKIIPQTKGDYCFSNLRNILPDYISSSIIDGMEHFGDIIDGFNDDDVILSAVESRTSSPVRIIRDETFQSTVNGLYPAGEGAGYAGGITSAAIDGMKIFEQISSIYIPFTKSGN